MEHKTVEKKETHFIGITVKIERPEEASFLIGALWDKFYREHIFASIPNAVNEDFFGIYFDYAGDHTKPYTMMAGCEVSTLADLPEGMKGVTAPAGNYAYFPVIGIFPDNLINKWKEVWKSDLKRSFEVDFEQYGPKFRTAPPQVDLYIGLRNEKT